ncbi:phosphopantetheine-binding protein [Pseudoduganella buxea]|uniref:Phosphopantetheine-binding protein n=1 Tax=Pseudoduganella buxea TaxID=1949069 RepID=A0A6I3T889_9BURK|nr:phosphopantetheine-binding protein [Pseudoduganella buxea]MTV55807.1 phosphopantetheine-binding protein [Pseudoduganella buxea]GGB95645.1 hypothetical protein GCM10011572_17020 [Pseudoduganella buxea]
MLAASTPLQERVLATLAANVAGLMPGIEASQVKLDGRLADYGCNSIDRTDIVWKTLDDLALDLPIRELAGVEDIQGFVAVLCRFMEAR